MAFSDDFTRADSATVGNGWTETDTAIFEILSNKLRGTGSASYQNSEVYAPAAADFADGSVQVDFNMVTTCVPQLWARANNGADQGYLIYWSGGVFKLAVRNAGLTDLQTTSVSLSTGVNYRMTFTLSGTTKTGVLRNLDTATDLATLVDSADSQFTGSGNVGLSMHSSGVVDYDNFSSAAEATASAALTGPVGAIESDIVNGTGPITIDWTLTGDTWIAAGTGPIGTSAQSLSLLQTLDSAQAEAAGWDAQVKANFIATDLTRVSDTVARATLGAEAAYAITAQETISAGNIPNALLTTSGTDLAVTGSFNITPDDGVPDAFSFVDQTDVALSTVITSAGVVIAGINIPVAVTCTGGTCSINGGAYSTSPGNAVNGDTITARHTSSASNSTATNTIVTIGGVNDTFTSTTLAAPVQFVSSVIVNNTGTVLASTGVSWTWLPLGRIGSINGITALDGTGTTDGSGNLTVTGMSAGAGVLLVADLVTDATDDLVYYEAGTAA